MGFLQRNGERRCSSLNLSCSDCMSVCRRCWEIAYLKSVNRLILIDIVYRDIWLYTICIIVWISWWSVYVLSTRRDPPRPIQLFDYSRRREQTDLWKKSISRPLSGEVREASGMRTIQNNTHTLEYFRTCSLGKRKQCWQEMARDGKRWQEILYVVCCRTGTCVELLDRESEFGNCV